MSDTTTITVGPKGRIVIPIEVRRRHGIAEGDELVVVSDSDGFRLMTRPALVSSLRGAVRSTTGRSVVDELITERQADAARGR